MLLTEMFGGGRAAPNIEPMDEVITPDGPGIVVDASQNRDGHYVWFQVDLSDGHGASEVHRYHIRDLKPVQDYGKATAYLSQSPDRKGQNFKDQA